MADKTARGRFVWHELTVPDSAKAHDFYAKVVGWKMQPFEQDPSYQMFAASTGPLGGTVVEADTPPHWLHYIGTTDIEATVRRATELGATVVKDIAQIANGGRWARLNDPQGAAFAVYQSTHKPSRQKPPKRGEFSWLELATTDYQAAFQFYAELFGWDKIDEVDMGPEFGKYFMFGRNGMPLGGMFNLMPNMQGGPFWLGYVRVKDVNKAVKKAKAAGATLANGPMEVPGGEWIAQLIDPQGAMFAVHVVKSDLEQPAQSAAAAPSAPAQGTLDFPPVESRGPESVDVAAQAPKKAQPAQRTNVKSEATESEKAATQVSSKAAGKSASAPSTRASLQPAKKPAAKKSAAKKPTAKKSVGKKTSSKRAAAKKASAKKAPAKKAASKKSSAKRPTRKAPGAKRAKRPATKKKARKGK